MVEYSIIVPVYNAELFISQCIYSILNQHFRDFELIIVDDCSTDRCFEICQKLESSDCRVNVIQLEKNSGVSAARNKGLEIAQGKYILFVDSDDFVSEDYLSVIDTSLHEDDTDLLCFGNYNYFMDQSFHHSSTTVNESDSFTLHRFNAWTDLALKTFFASPWNKAYKKSIIDEFQIMFDADCVCYEDYLFNICYCGHISSFRVINSPLYYYRQFSHIDHVSKRRWGELFSISKKVAVATDSFISAHPQEQGINQLRRYTYKAFMVETKAAILSGCNKNSVTNELLHISDFLIALDAIEPAGKRIKLIRLALHYHFYRMAAKLVIGLLK